MFFSDAATSRLGRRSHRTLVHKSAPVWHLFFHDAPEIADALISGREWLYLDWFHRNFAPTTPPPCPPRTLTSTSAPTQQGMCQSAAAAPGGLRALNHYGTRLP